MSYKILVIDDDPYILRLIKNILNNPKFDVTTRDSIQEINICDFEGFDLISSLELDAKAVSILSNLASTSFSFS